MKEERSVLRHEAEARQIVMSNIWKLNRMEGIAWRQRSRMLWFKEGGKNTKFFHNMVNVRRKINFIGRLRRDGRVF